MKSSITAIMRRDPKVTEAASLLPRLRREPRREPTNEWICPASRAARNIGGMTTAAPKGYYRFPAIHGEQLAFACEDDLWLIQLGEDRAHRLTASPAGELSQPAFSPDGATLAFVGKHEGPAAEIYTVPAVGGDLRRITWHGARCASPAWRPDGEAIVYCTNAGQPFDGLLWVHEQRLDEPLPRRLPWGQATRVDFAPDGGILIGRFGADPARWKRYRGGRSGQLWVDPEGSGDFQPLTPAPGDLHAPCWIGQRVYFISDHEGVGNVYSCLADGTDLRTHSRHRDFYARNLSSDGRRLVYHCGADLYLLDPQAAEPVKLDFQLGSSRPQRGRRFVAAGKYLDSAKLSPDATHLAITTRGKAFAFGSWEGLTFAEIKHNTDDVQMLATREHDRWGFRAPGGESYADLLVRVREWHATVGRDTIVVAHGGVARALIVQFGAEPPAAAAVVPIEQGVVYRFARGTVTRYA